MAEQQVFTQTALAAFDEAQKKYEADRAAVRQVTLAREQEARQRESAAALEPDLVNQPPHYTSHPSGVECLTITRHMGFNIGNAMKYLWRADLKGNPIENLRKAVFYIEDEIERRTGS